MPYKSKTAQREYQLAWYHKRRARYLEGKSCVHVDEDGVTCGSRDQLEFDHVDPALKVSHRIWNWAIARLEAELAKCQVLCRLHHLEKTRHDGSQWYHKRAA